MSGGVAWLSAWGVGHAVMIDVIMTNDIMIIFLEETWRSEDHESQVMATIPRARRSMVNVGGSHDRAGVVIDMRNCVLIDSIEVCVVDRWSDDEDGDACIWSSMVGSTRQPTGHGLGI